MLKLRFQPDGTIEAEGSLQELQEYHRAYEASRNGHKQLKLPGLKGIVANPSESDQIPETAQRLVRVLFRGPESGMESAEIANVLGVSPRGIGGSMMALMTWGRRHHLMSNDLIAKGRRRSSSGRIVRSVALGRRLRRMLEQGEVNGMKLET